MMSISDNFIGGIRGLEELERRVKKDMKVAFSMYPTSIQELFAVADAGALLGYNLKSLIDHLEIKQIENN